MAAPATGVAGASDVGAEQSVNEIAAELGYSGASAFIAMLRRELGQSPARYLQEGEGR